MVWHLLKRGLSSRQTFLLSAGIDEQDIQSVRKSAVAQVSTSLTVTQGRISAGNGGEEIESSEEMNEK